jgi:hypothetical protein
LSVAGAGDINGDGHDDVLIGAYGADNNGRDMSGSAYLIYGADKPADIDLASLGNAGFRVDGAGNDHNAEGRGAARLSDRGRGHGLATGRAGSSARRRS